MRQRPRPHMTIFILCCTLLILSGCSLFSASTNTGSRPTPTPGGTSAVSTLIPTETSPTPAAPLTDSDIVRGIVRNMTLEQKLGQMVIVEFYGPTLNADLTQMIQGSQVGGVLIENKNGNAQARNQLITLNQGMQAAAHIPLFITTDFEGGYLKGLTDGGVIGCLKHFPGLGSASIDPHSSLPSMNRSMATLNAVDLVPYRTLIAEGIVPMVMVTHILNPQLDPKLPTSLSPQVVTKLLRDQLQFKGVIISDTLWMGGISNTYNLAQAAVLAVKAGTDLLLGPRGLHDTQFMVTGLRQAVEKGQISIDQVNASVQRILELKLRYKIISHDRALQLIENTQETWHPQGTPGSAITYTRAAVKPDQAA